MYKLFRIYQGWKNYVFTNPRIEELAKKRARACSGCESAVKGRYEVLEDRKIKEVEGMICNMCLCPLSTKLRSPEETCPQKKW